MRGILFTIISILSIYAFATYAVYTIGTEHAIGLGGIIIYQIVNILYTILGALVLDEQVTDYRYKRSKQL